MKISYIDAHTHAQFAAYDGDRDAVIRRAEDSGIALVVAGTKKETSEAAVELAKQYEHVYAAVGLHPIHASHSVSDPEELQYEKLLPENDFDYAGYKKLAQDSRVVAIGECGLDHFHLEGDVEAKKKKQQEVFASHIELAREVKKPLMIHSRNAMEETIHMVQDAPGGIMHFFSGTVSEAKQLLDRGFYFTFGGVLTFVRDYDDVVRMIPADRILSETDAPYVAPVPYRGKRNEPAYVVEVVKKLAELKKMSVGTMAEKIVENAERIFGITIRA